MRRVLQAAWMATTATGAVAAVAGAVAILPLWSSPLLVVFGVLLASLWASLFATAWAVADG